MSVAGYLIRHPFIRFAMVGTGGYVVDTSVLALGTDAMGLDFDGSRAISIFVAMCATWIGNRYLTFPERRARTPAGAMQEWLKFLGANSIGAVINYGVSILLLHYGPSPLNYKYAAQVAGVLAGLVFNFTLSRIFVFKAPLPPV